MEFTTHPNKDYASDIRVLYEALYNEEVFSFSKFCDGEWAVLENRGVDNSEFWFDPEKEEDANKRQQLVDAFQFKHKNYYVGISCPGVFGLETHNKMKEMCGQPKERLTWADVWVNSNYGFYLQFIVPLFRNKKTVLYCNEKSNLEGLPFEPSKVFNISYNAWENDWGLIEESKRFIEDNDIEDHIFLFCCGPFGNILCHQLTEFNDKNTYLDIGSTLNPFLRSAGFERDYYMGDTYFSRLSGVWGPE